MTQTHSSQQFWYRPFDREGKERPLVKVPTSLPLTLGKPIIDGDDEVVLAIGPGLIEDDHPVEAIIMGPKDQPLSEAQAIRLTAATKARAIPVLPLVGSTMTVSPRKAAAPHEPIFLPILVPSTASL